MSGNMPLIRSLVPALLLASAAFSCNELSPRHECYAKNYCDTAVEDCVVGTTLLFGGLFSSSYYPYTYPTTTYYSSESEGNDTFAAAQSVYGNVNPSAISGALSNGTDVDMFTASYTSGTTASFAYRLSKTGTAACSAYTSATSRSGQFDANTAGLTLVGTLSSTQVTATLTIGSSGYLYIKCGPSGVGGETYTVTLTPVTTTTTIPTANYSSLTSLFMLSCATAKDGCKAECNKKHSY